jgi:hypothetical protein
MARGRAKAHEHPVETERGDLVADALFRLWRGSPDGLANFLERSSLVAAQVGEVLVNRAGLPLRSTFQGSAPCEINDCPVSRGVYVRRRKVGAQVSTKTSGPYEASIFKADSEPVDFAARRSTCR